MEWLLVLAGAVVAGTVGLVVTSSSSFAARMRTSARRGAAERCGLTEVVSGPTGTVTGRAGALRVRLDTVKNREALFRVEIEGVVDGVEMTRADRTAVPSDVVVGDPLLDAPLVLRGARATVRGLFAADVRALMLRVLALDADVHVRAGGLVAELRRRLTYADSLAERLTTLLELAHALEPGDADAARLARIVRTDPLESVRANALQSLAMDLPADPLTRPALRDATRDASRAIRLQAATALGEAGREVLYALASDPETEGALAVRAVEVLGRHAKDEEGRELLYSLASAPALDDAVAVRAVDALGRHLTLERMRPLLETAAAELRLPVTRALLRWMGRGGAPEAEVIGSLLARRIGRESSTLSPKGAEIALAAVEALGEAGSAAAEPPLIAALVSAVPGVPAAAARSLGRVGAARAVPALRDAEEREGEIRRAAREAIALIQSRLTGATPGQVSLAGGEAGQLSVVESPDGRVSLKTDEPSR